MQILTGYDVALQRQWRTEDRGWRTEDLEWRAFETSAMQQEQAFMWV